MYRTNMPQPFNAFQWAAVFAPREQRGRFPFIRPTLAVALLLTFGCTAKTKADGPSAAEPHTIEELRQAIAEVLQDTGVPGAGIALVSKDKVIWVGVGQADRATGREVTPETLFRAGSISKSFVALSVLKLRDDGKLHLDDRLRNLVGDAHFDNPWEETDPVLLAHVLEHTAGFDDLAIAEIGGSFPDVTLRTVLSSPSRSRTCRWKPGRFFSYSNGGPPLAAYAIERLTGRSFDRYLDEEILAPLRMETASFLLTDAVTKNLANGYQSDGVTEVPYCHIRDRPSGALNITPGELAHLVQLLLNRGTYEGVRLLTPESVERMETAATTRAAQKGVRAGYGLGNFTTFHKGVRFQGHDGGMPGFLARYSYAPERGTGYVIMINTAKIGAFSRVAGLVVDYLTHDWAPSTPPATAAVTGERLQGFAGYYEPCTTRNELVRFVNRLVDIQFVSVEGGALQVRSLTSGPTQLSPVNDSGVFRGASDPVATAAFMEVDDELVLSGLRLGNYRRVPAWWVWGQAAVTASCLVLMLSSILFALVWGPRKALGRMRSVRHLSVRLLPLAAVLCLLAAFAVPFTGCWSRDQMLDQLLGRLGHCTPWSLSFCILTWLFALATLAGLLQAIRARHWEVRPWIRYHSLFVSLSNSIVLAYLGYWGVIGLRTWVP